MITVSATNLRNHLFEYLDKASKGETIIIRKNNREVARLISTQREDWRDKMTVKAKILVTPEELVLPLDDVWEDYL